MNALFEERKRRGLSLKQLAAELAPLHQTTRVALSRLERNGRTDPLLVAIAQWSGGKITANDLVAGLPEILGGQRSTGS